jgi:ribosomal protein L29
MSTRTPQYDEDFYAWTQHQATLLREEKWQNLDYSNLAEELESLGKSEYRELEHRLDGLLMHLLKWRYQPSGRQTGHSWRSTIREHRRQLARLLRDSPSLRPRVPSVLPESYANARLDASDETGLPLRTFPDICPWTMEQVLDETFWPEVGDV